MKKHSLIALLALFILFSGSCNRTQCIDGDEYPLGRTRELEHFSAINVNLSAVVEIVKDTSDITPYLELVVENNLEKHLASIIKNDTLNISLGFCFSQHAEILIRVHYDTLNTIIVSGPGDVVSIEKLVQDDLKLDVRSSGDIILTTDIKNIESIINGTGEISINGQIENHTIYHNNAGTINTYQTMTDRAKVAHAGTGNIYLRVKDSITANLSNRGDLFYKGYPVLDTLTSGLGLVIDDN